MTCPTGLGCLTADWFLVYGSLWPQNRPISDSLEKSIRDGIRFALAIEREWSGNQEYRIQIVLVNSLLPLLKIIELACIRDAQFFLCWCIILPRAAPEY